MQGNEETRAAAPLTPGPPPATRPVTSATEPPLADAGSCGRPRRHTPGSAGGARAPGARSVAPLRSPARAVAIAAGTGRGDSRPDPRSHPAADGGHMDARGPEAPGGEALRGAVSGDPDPLGC